MNERKTVIEINGAKFEVDLRQATRIDNLRVGDPVKVLIKVYDGYKVYPGTVIGFEPFDNLPTIIIAYLESGYSTAGIKFLYFNAQSKETEIVKSIDNDILDINRADILRTMDKEIQTTRANLQDLEAKRKYFLDNFRAYWPYADKVGEKVAGEVVDAEFKPDFSL